MKLIRWNIYVPIMLIAFISICSWPVDKALGGSQEIRQISAKSNKDNPQKDNPGKYSIEQAISYRAQLHTIAFNGLAFITGDFGASTFIPPGKVCDFFGFQYMRDIDAAEKGHNPIFLNRVAGNVLNVLNSKQQQMFMELADEQASQLQQLAEMRLPLIKAFHMTLDNQIPEKSDGLNREAVAQYVGDIFEKDAELSLRRAEVMAKVYSSLDSDQKAYFAEMTFGDFNTWPDIDERGQLKKGGKGKPKLFNVAYMTYGSEFFSWTKGSVAADTYFCPERHGTYFGGFYMKDMPAMGKRDFDISTSVTGDSGKAFIDDVLTNDQRILVTGIPQKQESAMEEIIQVRRDMSIELRKLLSGTSLDREKIMKLGRRYGELDGGLSWDYATAFANINQTLSQDQRDELVTLRNLNGYPSDPYYIYSQGIKKNPRLPNVNSFFYEPKAKDR